MPTRLTEHAKVQRARIATDLKFPAPPPIGTGRHRAASSAFAAIFKGLL